MRSIRKTLSVLLTLCLLLCAFAPAFADATPSEAVPEEEEEYIFIANPMLAGDYPDTDGDDETSANDDAVQDWYDELHSIVSSYDVPKGTLSGDALRAEGQPTLSKDEIEITLALENSTLEEYELADSEGKINIILLGVDARPNQKYMTGRSDAMILCSVDVTNNTIKMISFMRDTYVSIKGYGANRLNTPYFFQGVDLLNDTLQRNFGVSFDHYIAVDYTLLADLIDQLGGLEIDLTEQYFVDRVNAILKMDNKLLGRKIETGLVAGPGKQLLNGKQAQAYARFRYGAKSGGDFGRTGRQREVIMKIFDKVTDLSIMQMLGLALNNLDKVATDLTIGDLAQLAPLALQMKNCTFEELRVPGDGEYSNETVNGMAVLVPKTEKCVESIRAFLAD